MMTHSRVIAALCRCYMRLWSSVLFFFSSRRRHTRYIGDWSSDVYSSDLPGSHHMRVSPTGRVSLDDGPRIGGYRPCADLTFDSAADYAGPMSIGIILTGMGNDGAKGVQTVKNVGGHVIAQDESTAVIFGMPQEAIKTGAVDQILPIEVIYNAVEKRVLYIFGAAKVGAL